MGKLLSAVVFLMLFGVMGFGECLPAEREVVPLDKLPKAVKEAIQKKFPKVEIIKAVQTEEDGESLLEVFINENDKQITVTVDEKGTIESFEKEIDAKDLPQPVVAVLQASYPKATYQRIEAAYSVEAKEDELEYYEVKLVTADTKEQIEVEISPSGEIVAEIGENDGWTHDFSADKQDLTSTGRNPFFVLEPGYQLALEDGDEQLTVTVLNETKMVDGVETRVVEERETKGKKLVEVSRNYFAISKRTNNVYYFGEDVDFYKDGAISGHEGSWLSGVKGARFGLAMPGLPLIGARYQQETAPDVAMDRAEISSLREIVKVPAGAFKNCLLVTETTPLEPNTEEYKTYAPGIGLIRDGSLQLVRYGKLDANK